MRHTLIAIFAALAFAIAGSAQDLTQMHQLVDKVNEKCPYEYAEGLILQSVTIEDGAIVNTFKVDPTKVDYNFLKENQDILHASKVAEIATDTKADSVAIRNVCTGNGVTIVYRYIGGPDDSFDITILPADLK